MLKSITIKYFRSHEETHLDFVSGTNVIIGLTQSGKTQIIRAILWLLRNRPLGTRMHSNFAPKEDSVVIVELMEGATVAISKLGSKGCSYKVTLPDGSINDYSGVGTDVPDEVSRILNMGEVNISEQIELPFLIADSPSDAGKTISRLIQLEKVEQWTSAISSKMRSANAQVKDLIVSIDSQKENLKEFENLHQLQIITKTLTQRDGELAKYIELEKDLIGTIDKINTLDKQIYEQCVVPLMNEPLIKKLQEKLEQYSVLESDLLQAELGVNKIKSLDIDIFNASKETQPAAQIEVLSGVLHAYSDVIQSISLIDKITDQNTLIQRMEEREKSLTFEYACSATAAKEIIKAKEEFDIVSKEQTALLILKRSILDIHTKLAENAVEWVGLKNNYGISLLELKKCPMCFNEITTEHVEKILEELSQ